ncbi:ABC transporter substrate-binding protein [Tenuifilum osseticum]|uniref:ABC transporter substrate-binding protein n=1 Tax=Tenuifilum osseticum TaxID=3374723 RepID=UPI0034E5CAB7
MNQSLSKVFCFISSLLIISCSNETERLSTNVFRYNESKGITSLDPAYARNLALIWPVSQIFNGLVQFSDSLTVEPSIAKRWSISPDGLTYTFYLRNDVYFHDSPVFKSGKGRRATAQDFVYSFGRILNPTTASPGMWVLSVLDRENPNYENGCYAPNDSTLVLKLKKPFPPFLGLLCMPYCYVVPHEAVSFYGKDFGHNPVGTGPFYLKLWRDGEKLVLRKNPNYFEVDELGNRLPYLEAVSISFIPDKQSEFLEFVNGKIDFLSGVNAASKDEILTRSGRLNPKYSDKVKMVTGPYLNTEYIGILIDSAKLPGNQRFLLDERVRKAIAMSFDKEKMMLYLRSNLGYPANGGFVPSGMPGFTDVNYGLAYNPLQAMQLLEQAGYSGKNALPEITVSTTDDYLDLFEFIQNQLSTVGIKLNIDVLPGAAYREMLANGKLPVFRGSWIADYPDPENYLACFLTDNFAPNGPNYSHFSSVQFEMLYRKAMSLTSYDQRLPYYHSLDSIVTSKAIVIPLYYDKVVRFTSARVDGIGVNPMNFLVLKKVKVKSIK